MKFRRSHIELRSEYNALILTRSKQRVSATPASAGVAQCPRAMGRPKVASVTPENDNTHLLFLPGSD